MTKKQLDELSVYNQQSFNKLLWNIEVSQGRFSLILATANSADFYTGISELLQELSFLKIGILQLTNSEDDIYSKITHTMSTKPSALMVFGLEFLSNLIQVLDPNNQVWQDFLEKLQFPLVLWVNEEILWQLKQLYPNFDSWAIITKFVSNPQKLISPVLPNSQIDNASEKVVKKDPVQITPISQIKVEETLQNLPNRRGQDIDAKFLPIVKSDEFLPSISRWLTLGGLMMIFTFVMAIILAAFTKYNVTVKAAATFRPTGEIKIVQANLEGTIKSISVQENMEIKKGDAIAYIDNSRLQTQKIQLQGNIQQNQLQLVQINSQLKSIDTQITAEIGFMNRSIASSQADLIRNQRDYQEKQIVSQADVAEIEANLKLFQQKLKSAEIQRDRYKQAAAAGIISQERYEETEQTVKDQQGAINATIAKLNKAKAALNPSTAPLTIAIQRIAQEKERGAATIANLNKERKALIQRQIDLQNQLNRDTREIEQVEQEVQKSVIRAPVNGIILKLNLRNSNQFVKSGESIAQIAPSNAVLLLKAHISAQDIGKISLGQKSQMRVSAYPYPDYGILNGKVIAIAPDATVQSNNLSGLANGDSGLSTPYYEVTIQPDKLTMQKGNRLYPIQAGMEVTADIITKEETFLTFILRKVRLYTNL